MKSYVAEILTTDKRGGLHDKTILVRAESPDAARAKVQSMYPKAHIGYVGSEVA